MSDKPVILTHAPFYANLYPQLVVAARYHGYALAVHGSMARDLDLVAVPWAEKPSTPDELVKSLSTVSYFEDISEPVLKEHGRMVYTLAWPGDCFVDLSVMPVLTPKNAIAESTGETPDAVVPDAAHRHGSGVTDARDDHAPEEMHKPVRRTADTTPEPMKKYDEMMPHEQRVVAEKQELDEKAERLDLFTGSDKFQELPVAERGRLLLQLKTMDLYSEILKQRIDAFE